MADFVAVLRKTIDGLAENNPAMREKVYEKARSTVAAKLAAISPPPAAAVAERQKQMLEDAIREVEVAYTPNDPDPFAELESVFAHLSGKEQPARPVEIKAPPPAIAAEAPVLAGSQVDAKPWPIPPEEAEAEPETIAAERPAVPFDGDDEEQAEEETEAPFEETRERRRSFVPLIAAVVVLALIAGGAYAVWLNKDDFMAMLGIGTGEAVATAPATDPPAPATTIVPETATKPAEEAPSGGAPADQQGVQKFTQRLNADGTEVDEGPAGGIASIGEGTSVAAVTQPPLAATPEGAAADAATVPPATDPAATTGTGGPAVVPPAGTAAGSAPAATETAANTASDAQVAVGQKAIFYEERTNVAEGSADAGSVVWSLVQESPGNDEPAEPAIRGEATIPGKDIQLRMTIRRNADKTLPASHIIELIFLTPDNFEGGGIENILRFALKDTEEAAGSPVLGIPAKIADGFFLVALNDTKAEIETNLGLLKRQRWIDVPLVYKSGRRALITMEKGVPGDKVFDEAIKAWQGATASAG